MCVCEYASACRIFRGLTSHYSQFARNEMLSLPLPHKVLLLTALEGNTTIHPHFTDEEMEAPGGPETGPGTLLLGSLASEPKHGCHGSQCQPLVPTRDTLPHPTQASLPMPGLPGPARTLCSNRLVEAGVGKAHLEAENAACQPSGQAGWHEGVHAPVSGARR